MNFHAQDLSNAVSGIPPTARYGHGFALQNSKLYVHCGCTSSDQNIDLRKVRTENVKIRTDPQDRVMDGWSVAQ